MRYSKSVTKSLVWYSVQFLEPSKFRSLCRKILLNFVAQIDAGSKSDAILKLDDLKDPYFDILFDVVPSKILKLPEHPFWGWEDILSPSEETRFPIILVQIGIWSEYSDGIFEIKDEIPVSIFCSISEATSISPILWKIVLLGPDRGRMEHLMPFRKSVT